MTGKKIRELRVGQKMTQAQLADGFITRNMLSQIENGLASPSLSTLEHIAERLGVPTEYFLSENTELSSFRKLASADRIKSAFARGDYAECIELLTEYGDDESELLLSMCYCEMGRKQYSDGELFSARKNFTEAINHSGRSVFAFEANIIAEKYVNVIDYVLGRGEPPAPRFDNCAYVAMIAGKSTFSTRHGDAKKLMSEGKFEEAEKKLGALLSEAKECGVISEYYLLADLEACLEKKGDFERAYSCADRRLALSEKMNK